MTRIFIAGLCAALAAACSAPDTDTHTEGVHLTSADKTNGVTGRYVAPSGVSFEFASVVAGDGVVQSTITHQGEVVLQARVTPGVREMTIGGIDLVAAVNDESWAAVNELDRYRDTPIGIAIMQFPASLKDELGVTDGEILKDYIQNYSFARMLIEAMTERPLAAEYQVKSESHQAYGCSDTCQAHGSDYYYHDDGTYDDISDDLTICDSGGGGGGDDPEMLEPYGCHGCCGPSCWGCTGIYTSECLAHDDCVASNGHWACKSGLWAAVKSMF